MQVVETPVREDPGAPDAPRAGGPPRFFALHAGAGGVRLAGTCGRGMARSTDGGRTWSPTGPNLRESDVNALVEGDDGALYAAAGTAGVLRSTDLGATWETAGPQHHEVFSLVPGDLLGTAHGLCRPDGSPVPGPSSAVYRLLRTSAAVLAATAHEGVWRGDGHGLWHTRGLDRWPVFALAAPDAHTVLAGTRGGGVHRSDDDGWSWSAVDWPFDPVVHTLVVAPNGDVLAGTGRGVVRSTDAGRTWRRVPGGVADHRIFSVAAAPDGSLLAGSYEAVWSWAPDTGRWSRADTGLSADEAFAVALTPSGDPIDGPPGTLCFTTLADGTLLAGTDDGIQRAGGARTWQPVGLSGRRVFRLFEPRLGTLLAGTLGHGAFHKEGDGDWHRITDGLDRANVYDFVRARRSGHLFAATGDLADGAKTGGVHTSADAGRTWSGPTHAPISVYRVVESAGGTLIAAAQRSHVLRSHDGGATWSVSRPQGSDDTSKVYALLIDERDRLFLASGARLLRSDDGADSWDVVGRGLDGVTCYALAATGPDTMYAATSSGLARSDDAGVTWAPIHR